MATRWIVLIGLVVARIAFGFQLQSIAVVAPGLMDDMSLSNASLGTIIGLFMLPGLVFAIPSGFLSAWIGERRFLIACLAAMTTGGLICGFADSYLWLWLGRVIAGFGTIGINVVMIKVVIDWFQGREIATATALYLTGFPVGIGLALVTLGQWATAEAWPIALYAAAGLSFAALITFIITYRSAERAEVGTGPAPRLSLGEFGMVSLSGLIWALYNATYIMMVIFVPLFLISDGMATTTAAAVMGVGIWVAILAVPLAGIFVDKFGQANIIIVAAVLISRFGLLLVIPWSDSVPLLLALLVATSFISGLAPGPIVALASQVLRPETRAVGMGVFYTWLYGGLALGPVLGGLANDLAGDPAAPLYLICVLAILMVAAFGLFLGLQARGHPAVLSLEKT